MASMNDDSSLVRRALKGDRKAFEMIILRYQQPMVNYLARMTGERQAALDFAQDVFLKAYASLGSYRPSFKFSTWLFKIASNHMIDHWRKKRITAVSLDQPYDDGAASVRIQVEDRQPQVARAYEMAELRAKIEKLLAGLPDALRELFVLRHVNEFAYEEIADIKGLPVGTVKNRVFQAKELLRRKLEETP
jgi:RNA polymerase sigma-70 factor (ECF subfamily)